METPDTQAWCDHAWHVILAAQEENVTYRTVIGKGNGDTGAQRSTQSQAKAMAARAVDHAHLPFRYTFSRFTYG